MLDGCWFVLEVHDGPGGHRGRCVGLGGPHVYLSVVLMRVDRPQCCGFMN